MKGVVQRKLLLQIEMVVEMYYGVREKKSVE